MNTQKKVFNKLFKEEKTELAAQKVELALIDDVEKGLDSVISRKNRIVNQIIKLSSDLLDLTADCQQVLSMAKKGENSAKELGVEDVRKMFGARSDEAKYYKDVLGKAANKIESAARSI